MSTQIRRRTQAIDYTFTFADGSSIPFRIELDGSLAFQRKSSAPPPNWTSLNVFPCAHCPLDKGATHCPVAVNLAGLAELFRGKRSHEEVEVCVETGQRKTIKRTALQYGVSSLIGIIMATSGCPVLDKLRPLVATHLPFATPEESCYRIVTTYLFGQYFRRRRVKSGTTLTPPDWDLNKLVEFLEEIQFVNEGLCKRLNAAALDSDVLLNAVNILNTAGALSKLYIEEDGLQSWEQIFAAH